MSFNNEFLESIPLSVFLENMSEGFVVHDSEGKIIAHNSEALRILGLTEGQLVGRDVMDPQWKAIKPDGSAFPFKEHPSEIARLEKIKVRNVIMGVNDSNRGLRWLSVNATPTESRYGVIAIVNFKEMTQEFSVANKLETTNQRLELALEGAALGIWDWDLRDNSVVFDNRWASMLGLDINKIDMTLSTWETLVHPDDLEGCYKDIKAYMNNETSYYENIHRMKHANGKWIYILDRGRFSERDKEGKPIRFTGTHFDVTELKTLQIESKNREKEYRFVLDKTEVGIWKYNPVENSLKWDDNMYELYDLEKEKFSGAYDAWTSSLHPDYLASAHTELQNALNGVKPFDTTFAIKTEKGLTKYIRAKAVVERDSDGKPISMIGINIDKTPEILAQQEFEKERLKLIQSSKLAMLGEMAAGVAHEINNPLAIISGCSDIVAKDSTSPETKEKSLDRIKKSVTRISKIVNGLKKFSRTTDKIDLTEVPVRKIFTECMDLIDVKAKRHKVSIRYSLDNDESLYCDEIQIEQIVLNLLSNSIDEVSNKEGSWIELSFCEKSKFCEIIVRDSGNGIAQELVDKIFQPFYTTKTVGKGTGLGLSISKGIAQEHGGDLEYRLIDGNTAFVLSILKKEKGSAA